MSSLRPGLPITEEREEIKWLRKELFELRRASEILEAASVLCCDRARRGGVTQCGRRRWLASRGWARCREYEAVQHMVGSQSEAVDQAYTFCLAEA